MKGLVTTLTLVLIAFGVTEKSINNEYVGISLTDGIYTESTVSGNDILDAGLSADDSDWELLLVNKDHPIPANYRPELTTLSNGKRVDSRIYPDLQEMFDNARAEGLELFVREGYRTTFDQKKIMDERIWSYIKQGYSIKKAGDLAREYVATPGTSEHQLGICVDINADTSVCSEDDLYQWLYDNSYKYGFIKRYCGDKSDITGISDEPWHYRYVGREAAAEIHDSGLCLEEYLGQ